MNNQTPDFQAALVNFVMDAQEMINTERRVKGYSFPASQLSIDPNGQKYVRIVSQAGNSQRFVYCFVEKSTGNVLKAAGWKAPAKGVRSNIYAADHGISGVTPYGAVYAR